MAEVSAVFVLDLDVCLKGQSLTVGSIERSACEHVTPHTAQRLVRCLVRTQLLPQLVNFAAYTLELLLPFIGFALGPTSTVGADDDARVVVGGESLNPNLGAEFGQRVAMNPVNPLRAEFYRTIRR